MRVCCERPTQESNRTPPPPTEGIVLLTFEKWRGQTSVSTLLESSPWPPLRKGWQMNKRERLSNEVASELSDDGLEAHQLE